jgi:hypothetical protein
MCSIFIEDFFFEASKATSEEVLEKSAAEELSGESKEPAEEPLSKRKRSS